MVSGLAKYIPLEELAGRRVVIVANLKPANMRGVKSQAMVLAASSPDGSQARSSLGPPLRHTNVLHLVCMHACMHACDQQEVVQRGDVVSMLLGS